MSRRTSTAVARLPGAGGSPWTAAPRTCENAPAATGRGCRPARRAAGSASCARPQTNRPKTADRTRSTRVASAFAERRRAAAGVQRSRWQRLGDRSAGVERIESQTKGGLACASLFVLILFPVNLLLADVIIAMYSVTVGSHESDLPTVGRGCSIHGHSRAGHD